MKKLFVLAVVAVMALGASAQNWYVGGAFGYAHQTVETDIDGTNVEVKSDIFTIAVHPSMRTHSHLHLGKGRIQSLFNQPLCTLHILPYRQQSHKPLR